MTMCNGCGKNEVIDFSYNPMILCNRCLWSDVISRYDMGGKSVDTGNMMDQVEIDKQEMVDNQWNKVL